MYYIFTFIERMKYILYVLSLCLLSCSIVFAQADDFDDFSDPNHPVNQPQDEQPPKEPENPYENDNGQTA
jgi:hypothetical protein